MTDTQAEPAATPAASVDTLIQPPSPALDFTQGKPEGFPDDFWDAEKKAPVIDKLYKSYETEKKRADGLRVKLSKGEFEGKAPDDIKEYTLELSDELKPLVADDDPIVDTLRKSAKEAGMPKEMFNKLLIPAITKLAEMNAENSKPLSPEEIAANRIEEINKLGPSGSRIVEACGSFIEQLRAGGTFSEAEATTAKAMVFDADSARVMNKLRMMTGGRDQVPVEVPIDVKASRSDIETKMAAAMVAGNEAEYNKYSSMLAKLNN